LIFLTLFRYTITDHDEMPKHKAERRPESNSALLTMEDKKMGSLKSMNPKGKEIDMAALAAKKGDPDAFVRLHSYLERYILRVSANFMDGREQEDVAQELRLLLFKVLSSWELGKGREFRQYYIGAMKKHLWKLRKKATRMILVSIEEMEAGYATG